MQVAEDIFMAIEAKAVDRVRLLAKANPDVLHSVKNGATPILWAMYHGAETIAQMLAPIKDALNIFEAAALGDESRVMQLAELNPGSIDAFAPDGFTPLGLAAFLGRKSVVELLVGKGAGVNITSRNAFHVAPLHSAVAGRNVEIVKLLLEGGADVNAKQQSGYTPLHAAAHGGELELVLLLLHYGSDPNIANEAGEMPMDLARAQGHSELTNFLTTWDK